MTLFEFAHKARSWVKIIKRYIHVADYVQQGCIELVRLITNDEPDKWNIVLPANRSRVAMYGGIQVTIDALNRHAGHPGVQEIGCFLLYTLALDNPVNQRQIYSYGGIDVLIQTLHKHSHCSKIQEYAALCLCTITNDHQDILIKVVQLGGVALMDHVTALIYEDTEENNTLD